MGCEIGEATEGLENEAVTAHSITLPLLHLRHRHFTCVTWRAAHTVGEEEGMYFYPQTMKVGTSPLR